MSADIPVDRPGAADRGIRTGSGTGTAAEVGGFDVAARRDGERVLLSVTGDLDAATSRLFTACAVAAAGTRPCRSVELDLHGVTFLDCAGLSALIRLGRAATREGRCVRIVRSSRPVDRLLNLTEIDTQLRAGRQVTTSS